MAVVLQELRDKQFRIAACSAREESQCLEPPALVSSLQRIAYCLGKLSKAIVAEGSHAIDAMREEWLKPLT